MTGRDSNGSPRGRGGHKACPESRELTTDARHKSSHEGRALCRSRAPRPGDSNHSGKARMVEAAGIEPASENVPRKALQA